MIFFILLLLCTTAYGDGDSDIVVKSGFFAFTAKTKTPIASMGIGQARCPSGSVQPNTWSIKPHTTHCCLTFKEEPYSCTACGLGELLKDAEFWKKNPQPLKGAMTSVTGIPFEACNDVKGLRCLKRSGEKERSFFDKAGDYAEWAGAVTGFTPAGLLLYAAGWFARAASGCAGEKYAGRGAELCVQISDKDRADAPTRCHWCVGQTYTDFSRPDSKTNTVGKCTSIDVHAGQYVSSKGSIHDSYNSPSSGKNTLAKTFTWYYPLNFDFQGVSPTCNSETEKDLVIPFAQYRGFTDNVTKNNGPYIDAYCKKKNGVWPCPNYPSYDKNDFIEQGVIERNGRDRQRFFNLGIPDPIIKTRGAMLCAAAKEMYCGPGRSPLGQTRQFARARLVRSIDGVPIDDSGAFADDGGQGLRLTEEDYDAVCPKCPPGKYSEALYDYNKNRISQCELCPPGKFAPNNGSKTCMNARLGHYVDTTGQARDTQAPIGTYVNTTGATWYQPCPDYYSTERPGSTSEGKCSYRAIPPGWYVNTTISTKGTTYSIIKLEELTVQCPVGTSTSAIGEAPVWLPYNYSRIANITRNNECMPCPKGQFSNLKGSVYCSKCQNGLVSNQDSRSTGCKLPPSTPQPVIDKSVSPEEVAAVREKARRHLKVYNDFKQAIDNVTPFVDHTFASAPANLTDTLAVLLALHVFVFAMYVAVLADVHEDTNIPSEKNSIDIDSPGLKHFII